MQEWNNNTIIADGWYWQSIMFNLFYILIYMMHNLNFCQKFFFMKTKIADSYVQDVLKKKEKEIHIL